MGKSVSLVIGASSGIGRCIAESLVRKGDEIIICARHERDLRNIADDLTYRYNCTVKYISGNINFLEDRQKIIDEIKEKNISSVFITVGIITENDNGILPENEIDELVHTNYLSIIKFISQLLKVVKSKVTISVVTSIAIGRPRRNNIIYASSKAGLDFYCRGLQHLFADSYISIKIFRIGFVDTEMSFGRKLIFPVKKPEKVSKYIIKKSDSGGRIFYYPGYWRILSEILKLIPWFIYKRISF